MSDEFILVTKSGKRSKKQKVNRISNPQSSDDFDLDKCIKKLENYKSQELEHSEFIEKVLKQLEEVFKERKVKEVICLGIGRVSEDTISKYQLLFILIVQEKFKIDKIKFYDPVLDENDRKVLSHFGCEVLTENTEGKYKAEEPTLYYLPHCPKQITNNLLYSNWNTKALKNLVLICNSFKSIIESTPERLLRPNAHYLLEISSYVKEIDIHNCFRFNDIFNDLSIHHFQPGHIPDYLWSQHPEPTYSADELEFIKNVDSSKDTPRDSQ